MGKIELKDRNVQSSRTQSQGEDRFQKALEKVQQERENRERNLAKNTWVPRSA